MKVNEARQIYSQQIKTINTKRNEYLKQKEELEQKIKSTENGASVFAKEAATLELNYDKLTKKQDEYQKYIDQLMEQWNLKFNEVATKESAESAKEGFDELNKIMEVVRRMSRGDFVPLSDERKVMEYDSDMYQLAKSAQAIAQMRKKGKEHDSLWGDEEKRDKLDPSAEADNQEAIGVAPEVMSVEEITGTDE